MQLLTKAITALTGFLIVGQATAAYTAKQIYQFPNTPSTDIENVAIRPNGQLILSIITSPSVYTLDPSGANPTAVHLHDFANAASCLGITEVASDQFAIVVGNVSTTTFSGVPGTFVIYKINFTQSPPAFTTIATVPQAKILNGLTHVASNPSIILAADSEQGIIYSINAATEQFQPPSRARHLPLRPRSQLVSMAFILLEMCCTTPTQPLAPTA